MRTQLEGKAYVERYVHTLTHELKARWRRFVARRSCCKAKCRRPSSSVLSAISTVKARACSSWIERLLNLAQVEQRQGLEERVAVPLARLVDELPSAQAARIEGKQLRVEQTNCSGSCLTW